MAYTKALRDAVGLNDLLHWTRVFLFQALVLDEASSSVPGKVDFCELSRRLLKWEVDQLDILWSEFVLRHPRPAKTTAKRAKSSSTPKAPHVQAAVDLAREGSYSKAFRLLLSRGKAPLSDATLAKLRELHPPRRTASSQLRGVPAPKLSNADVLAAMESFATGTACGPGGLRVAHLTELIRGDPSQCFLDALTLAVNLLCSGSANPVIREFLASAALLPINKKDGGIRPIAIGEVLRRLVSKCLIQSSLASARQSVGPSQFGVGAPGGSERLIHRLRRLVDTHRGVRGFVIVKIDIKNAFNSVCRSKVFAAVSQHMPSLLPWVLWCYDCPSKLFVEDVVLTSAEGVQQGDPLGPLLFSLAIRSAIDSLDSLDCPDSRCLLANWWYLDDGILAGQDHDVLLAVTALRSALAELGLTLNDKKCEVVSFGNAPADIFPPDFARRADGNFDALGSPIGDATFTSAYIQRKVLKKAREALSSLRAVEDVHVRYTLLRHCVAFGPLVHIMRTVPPTLYASAAKLFDSEIRNALCDIVALPRIPDTAWAQATLRITSGGLGLRSCFDHMDAAFMAGCLQAARLDGWDTTSDAAFFRSQCTFAARHRQGDEFDSLSAQKEFSTIVELRIRKDLMAVAHNNRDWGRLVAVAGREAGAFWNVIPSLDLMLSFSPPLFRVLTKWWLGIPLYEEKGNCPLCGAPRDCQGYHSLTCKARGHLSARHSALSAVVFESARQGHLAPKREQRVLGDNQRPADLFFADFVIDFAVTHPLVPANIVTKNAAKISRSADTYADKVKRPKYEEAVTGLGYTFVPAVVDTFGNWGSMGRQLINTVSEALSSCDNRKVGLHRRQLIQRCAVALMKCNARAMLLRLDPDLAISDALPAEAALFAADVGDPPADSTPDIAASGLYAFDAT
jgi:hypothetical protein